MTSSGSVGPSIFNVSGAGSAAVGREVAMSFLPSVSGCPMPTMALASRNGKGPVGTDTMSGASLAWYRGRKGTYSALGSSSAILSRRLKETFWLQGRPLESMLKTTTETGDIGMFSIRPVRSSVTFHGPFRTRPVFGDISFARPCISDGVDTASLGDEGRRVPSYRDTASEIISMYGSDSQRSASSSLSPPFEGVGQRSYSMTSCSSRPLPNYKPTGTMHSQSSAGLLQRPRSPFPYPTRLKRPGVRPSSPALTENGCIDYSRMVEIDRLSHRTVHGSYKPTYPQYRRRPSPGSSRLDSRSGPSFSSYNVPRFSSGQPSSAQSSGGNRFRGRLDSGTSEHSLRTSSLTSIVDMYRPSSCAPPTQKHAFRPQPPGAFYYDYSEDFDVISESVAASCVPFAPIPTRAPSMHRPMVLDDICNLPFHENDERDLAASFRTHPIEGQPLDSIEPAMTQNDPYPYNVQQTEEAGHHHRSMTLDGQDDHIGDRIDCYSVNMEPSAHNPLVPCEAMVAQGEGVCVLDKFVVGLSEDKLQLPKSPKHLTEIGILEKSEEPSCKLTLNPLGVIDHERHCDSDGRSNEIPCSATPPVRSSSQPPETHPSLSHINRKESVCSTVSGHRHRSKFYSIEPGLSDLASLVQCLDKAAKLSCIDDITTSTTTVGILAEKFTHTSVEIAVQDTLTRPTGSVDINVSLKADKNDGEEITLKGVECVEEDTRFRGHRRKLAVPNINTSQLSMLDPNLAAIDHSTMSILSPVPISPGERHISQNSVPLLMKALPPLPGCPIQGEDLISSACIEDYNVPFRFSPFDHSGHSAPASFQYNLSPAGGANDPLYCEHETCDQEDNIDTVNKTSRKKGETQDWTHVPLRDPPSGQLTLQQEYEEGEDIAVSDSGEDRKAKSNAKLKLKVSRGAMSKTQEEPGTLRRKMVDGTSELWGDSSEPWENASDNRHSPVSAHVDTEFGSAKYEVCDQENAFICSPTPSTPVATLSTPHEARCAEEGFAATQTPMSSISQASPSVIRSSFSDGDAAGNGPSRGLRKHVSDLRSPTDDPRTNPGSVEPDSSAEFATGPTDTREALVPSKSPDGSEDAPSLRSRGFRGLIDSSSLRSVAESTMLCADEARQCYQA
ncbi:hypothetical protein B0T19DRAFT_454738 [Cercophora scortea]|uniref:Uncharacterized protein n=1 Tax=Cercophora scortea TaxID=314031 RepID=A0AAE0J551_9PEZI|nr:hypothetical protein B0T19DRAFT_454738 [Cercophora scortea]